MLLKSKKKVYFAIDPRAITTLTWACFDKFSFAHEAVSTARMIPAPLLAVWPARCLARETGGLRLRKLLFSSAGVQPSSPNQPRVRAPSSPADSGTARALAGTGDWRPAAVESLG